MFTSSRSRLRVTCHLSATYKTTPEPSHVRLRCPHYHHHYHHPLHRPPPPRRGSVQSADDRPGLSPPNATPHHLLLVDRRLCVSAGQCTLVQSRPFTVSVHEHPIHSNLPVINVQRLLQKCCRAVQWCGVWRAGGLDQGHLYPVFCSSPTKRTMPHYSCGRLVQG